MTERLVYYTIRTLTFPIGLLPYSAIHAIGRFLGRLVFYLLPDFRKRTLSNLALAKRLALSKKQMIEVAIESFQNLAINCLEYPKLSFDPRLDHVKCINPEIATAIHAQGKQIIFFVAHQANWELLFLDGTSRMKGVAIGKSIKNKMLYRWILRIREQQGGKIICLNNAIREGLKALKSGSFLGIVGDQGMPTSGYSFPFLGRTAWTSTAPALLAYRTDNPIVFAEICREGNEYQIRYSDPLWPDLSSPAEKEIPRLMDLLMHQLEKSVIRKPGQWFWQHNRWKQQTPKTIFREFRHDCLAVILPEDPTPFHDALLTLRELYSKDFFVLIAPKGFEPPINVDELIHYNNPSEIFREDYRFKIIFNFTSLNVKRHYKRLSAFTVLDLKTLGSPATLKQTLCRQGSYAG